MNKIPAIGQTLLGLANAYLKLFLSKQLNLVKIDQK
jgi:hypothetical protein